MIVLGAALSVLPGGRAIYRAALLLPAVFTTSQPAPLVASGGGVRHSRLTLPSQGGAVYLDVYEPTDPTPAIPGAREGLLIVPGVGDNRDVPDLINLSTSLARVGFVVMEMTTPTLIDYDLTPLDADGAVQAVLALRRWPGVGHDRVGVLGLSAGDALACLAAADPRLRGKLAYLTLFGGYYDTTSLLRDIGRRGLDVDGRIIPWHPNDVPINVMADATSRTLPPADGAKLKGALGFGGAASNGVSPPLSADDLARMSPGAVAAYHLLYGDQPDQVEANIAALPPATHQLLRDLAPRSVVDSLHVPIYLLHDTGDEFVPFTESRDFAAALTRLGRPHDFVELNIFAHVEVRGGVGIGPLLGDGAQIFAILYKLLLIAS